MNLRRNCEIHSAHWSRYQSYVNIIGTTYSGFSSRPESATPLNMVFQIVIFFKRIIFLRKRLSIYPFMFVWIYHKRNHKTWKYKNPHFSNRNWIPMHHIRSSEMQSCNWTDDCHPVRSPFTSINPDTHSLTFKSPESNTALTNQTHTGNTNSNHSNHWALT